MERSFETMPQTIDDAFDKMLKRIEEQGPGSAAMGRRTLRWVYYARRPLRMEELRQALVVEEDDSSPKKNALDATSIIDCCMSFITCDITGEVRFIHSSVRMWLDHNKHQHGKLLTECDLARTCLTYLSFDVFDESIDYDLIGGYPFYRYVAKFLEPPKLPGKDERNDLENLLACTEEASRVSTKLHERYPLLGYASRYWIEHCLKVSDNEISGHLQRFSQSNALSTWVEVCSVYDAERSSFPSDILLSLSKALAIFRNPTVFHPSGKTNWEHADVDRSSTVANECTPVVEKKSSFLFTAQILCSTIQIAVGLLQ